MNLFRFRQQQRKAFNEQGECKVLSKDYSGEHRDTRLSIYAKRAIRNYFITQCTLHPSMLAVMRRARSKAAEGERVRAEAVVSE